MHRVLGGDRIWIGVHALDHRERRVQVGDDRGAGEDAQRVRGRGRRWRGLPHRRAAAAENGGNEDRPSCHVRLSEVVRNVSTFSTARRNPDSTASVVVPALWGVSTTLVNASSGSSGKSGSV